MGSSDRRPYESATVLNQSLLDESLSNLTVKLEMVAEIQDIGSPPETIYVSDRAKYVDAIYYEPRVKFPVINRTIGDWLAGELEFDSLTLTVNNTDKRYSHLIMGGSAYNGFVGKRVIVKIGLGEISGSYLPVFTGEITDVGGFSRDVSTFTLICRSIFDKVNVTIPNQVFITDDWPYIEDEFVGLGAPVIYGDWTTNLRSTAPEIPAFPINGLDPLVNASLDPPDPNVGDEPLRCVISSTPIKTLDVSSITLLRADKFYVFDPSDIAIVAGSDNQVFDITQKNLSIDGTPWIYETGDQFFVKCIGVDLSGLESNLVAQAKDILKRFGGMVDGDFDASWATYAAKATPSQSAIASIKSRVWLQESQKCLAYVLSMLEQVRLETFIDRLSKFKLSSLHFEDFTPAPTFTVRNWDIIRGSFKPQSDQQNLWNRAKADYCYSPPITGQRLSTGIYRNNVAIAQQKREISKLVSFPNLYIEADVVAQLGEMIKLASCESEFIEMTLTTRAFLKDISDEMILDINIGAVDYQNVAEPVTGLIREIGYDPQGLVIPIKVWCLQMIPFPGSEKSGISGITGGSTAIITKET